MEHTSLTMAPEGTAHNFVLRKRGTEQYADTKMLIVYVNPQAILIKIN
jgi:hypothetical protein